MLHRPLRTAPMLDQGAREAQERLLRAEAQHSQASVMQERLTVKPNCHVRLSHLPPIPRLHKPNVSAIRAVDANTFIQVSGTVIRTGSVRCGALPPPRPPLRRRAHLTLA